MAQEMGARFYEHTFGDSGLFRCNIRKLDACGVIKEVGGVVPGRNGDSLVLAEADSRKVKGEVRLDIQIKTLVGICRGLDADLWAAVLV